MDNTNKDVYIRCRVSQPMREAWIKACDQNVQNGSELLRRYIKDYIEKSGLEIPNK